MIDWKLLQAKAQEIMGREVEDEEVDRAYVRLEELVAEHVREIVRAACQPRKCLCGLAEGEPEPPDDRDPQEIAYCTDPDPSGMCPGRRRPAQSRAKALYTAC